MLRPLVVVCVLLASLLSVKPALAFRSDAVGSRVPAATVKDLSGRDVNLTFSGRAVVLFFWRANQAFSQEALKDLEQIKKEFSPRGVEIFAVAEGGMATPVVQGAIKNLGLSYPVYLDAEHRIEEKIGGIVFPSTGIVGSGGGGQVFFA